jgi:copper(I)-binding protein
MLIDLLQPLELGATFDMTLTFENGAELTTAVEVRDE